MEQKEGLLQRRERAGPCRATLEGGVRGAEGIGWDPLTLWGLSALSQGHPALKSHCGKLTAAAGEAAARRPTERTLRALSEARGGLQA